jgi:hypothetical protein
MAFIPLLADTFTEQVKAVTHGSRVSSRDILIVLSVGLTVGFVLGAYIYFRFRKKRKAADTQRVGRKVLSSSAISGSEDEDSGEHRRVRKRRRRRDHRPRNPSLQQTGGLPPPRPDDELPKY